MEIDDNSSTALGTETLADRDMVPLWFRQRPGFLGRYPTNRDFRAPEVPEEERSATLRSGQKMSQDLGP